MKTEDLVEALTALDETTFSKVYMDVVRNRRTRVEAEQFPPVAANRDQFAHWLARRHLISDVSISQVIYLPGGSPPNEIRFLEVNGLLNISEPDIIEPLEFSPDIRGFSYKLFVADISEDQWEHVKKGSLALPEGWKLEENINVARI